MIERFRIIFVFAVLLWVIELINLALGHSLGQFGILPRTVSGLPGILLSPFLHGNPQHLGLNTLPILVLGFFMLTGGVRRCVEVSLTVIVLGGLFVWCVGREAYHVGASGLIFGWFGFLIADAWYQRSLRAVLVAVVTVIMYGGLIFGVLPSASYISWEAHLGGFIAGIAAARIFNGSRGGRRRVT